MHRPDQLTTYLITPQFVMEAMIGRLFGGELVAAYASLRFLYVLLAAAAVFALARAVFDSVRVALVVSLLACIWVVVDPDPFALMASLYPLARRGSIAAGILLPVAATFAVDAVRLGGWGRRTIVALLAVITLMTHATEGAHLMLFLAAGVVIAGLIWRRQHRFWTNCIRLFALSLVLFIGFRAVHQQVVAHIAAYEAPRQAQLLAELKKRVAEPWSLLVGPLESAGSYVFGAAMPVLPYPLLALCAGAALFAARRPMAAWLWAALLAIFLMFLVPGASLLAMYLTTSELYFVFGALTILSAPLLGAAIDVGAASGERWLAGAPVAPQLRGICLAGTALLASFLSWKLVERFVVWSSTAPWANIAAGASVLIVALAVRRKQKSSATATEASLAGAVVFTLAFGIPLALGPKALPGQLSGSTRESLPIEAAHEWKHPDPLNFEAFYGTLAPPIPWDVILWLRRTVPPEKVLLYEPKNIYWLAVYLNDYIVHSSVPLSTDDVYFNDWVPRAKGNLFYDAPSNAELEGRFLESYSVRYIIVDPDNQERLGRRLASEPSDFTWLSSYDNYSIYRVRQL
jgi:hypothetical protein